jgi:hypothetical protein
MERIRPLEDNNHSARQEITRSLRHSECGTVLKTPHYWTLY